jgi:hypothetical protein
VWRPSKAVRARNGRYHELAVAAGGLERLLRRSLCSLGEGCCRSLGSAGKSILGLKE